jgi:hypothetical protein
MTEEEIAADVLKALAMEEGSDKELNEPQQLTIKKLFSCRRNDFYAVISYVGCLTNQELQAYYEHLRTVREILIKEQQERSVPTKLYVQKQVQLLSLILINVCIVFFLYFLNKGSTVIFSYLL